MSSAEGEGVGGGVAVHFFVDVLPGLLDRGLALDLVLEGDGDGGAGVAPFLEHASRRFVLVFVNIFFLVKIFFLLFFFLKNTLFFGEIFDF